MTYKREFFDQKYFARRYKFTLPSEKLADLVDCFWEMSPAAPEYIPAEVNEKIFANISSSLIFNLGSPFYVYNGNNCNMLKESVFIGYRTLPAIYRHLRENNLFGIKFKPGAWSVFFNIGAEEMKNGSITFEELSHDSFVTEQMASSAGMDSKIAIAEDYLLKRLNEKNNFKYNTVKKTLNVYIANLAASRKLNYISKELNTIPKTLYRYFNDIIGLSPKTCLNILRLREAIKHYAFERGSFNVYDYGYFDYSHFIKEIKNL